MIVLPGPAFIVIPIGLAILATEFVWAKKWLDKVKEKISEKKRNCRFNFCPNAGTENYFYL
jgi:hypothetical protein